jgi:hypothetical protein
MIDFGFLRAVYARLNLKKRRWFAVRSSKQIGFGDEQNEDQMESSSKVCSKQFMFIFVS